MGRIYKMLVLTSVSFHLLKSKTRVCFWKLLNFGIWMKLLFVLNLEPNAMCLGLPGSRMEGLECHKPLLGAGST